VVVAAIALHSALVMGLDATICFIDFDDEIGESPSRIQYPVVDLPEYTQLS